MGVAYQGSMSKLVLRFQFVRAYINIYTCPLERITLQLFRERLSGKVHATIPKGIVGARFWVHCYSKKFERMAREAIDVCLRMLKESNNRKSDSYSVRNSVTCWSHPILPFGIVACTFFPTTFLEIAVYVCELIDPMMVKGEKGYKRKPLRAFSI